MNWRKSIILAFILFGAFIATLVAVCVKQNVDLVTKEYYKEELAYQGQIDRIARTGKLAVTPLISVESESLLRVTYDDFSKIQQGALELFRPSDPAQDKQFALPQTDEPAVFFSTEGMEKGMYRARLRWQMDGKEYFLEQVIQL